MKSNKKFPSETVGEVRRKIVLQKIAENKQYWTIVEELKTEWKVGESLAKEYIREALRYLNCEEFKEVVKGINTQRLEQIVTESIGTDNKTAIKAIDLQNKTLGIYEEKIKLESEGEVEIHVNL